MSLSDIMRHADLALWPQIAMVIFLGVFIAVTVRAVGLRRRMDVDRAARLALEDDAAPAGAETKEAAR